MNEIELKTTIKSFYVNKQKELYVQVAYDKNFFQMMSICMGEKITLKNRYTRITGIVNAYSDTGAYLKDWRIEHE